MSAFLSETQFSMGIYFPFMLNTHPRTGHKTQQERGLCFKHMIFVLPNTHPRTGHKTWYEQMSLCLHTAIVLHFRFISLSFCQKTKFSMGIYIPFLLNTHPRTGHKTQQKRGLCFEHLIFVLPNTHPRTGHKTWHEQMSLCLHTAIVLHFRFISLSFCQKTKFSMGIYIPFLLNTHPRTGHKTQQEWGFMFKIYDFDTA